jgi:chromosomal replication initiation ATPase DnaA
MAEIVSTRSIAGIGTPAQKPEVPALPALGGQLPAVPGRITVRGVLRVTAKYYGMTPDELVSDRRTRPVVRRRQVAMYVAYRMIGRGTPFIAYYIGKRRHTTIRHGVRVIEALLDAGDVETVTAVVAIRKRLQVLQAWRLAA